MMRLDDLLDRLDTLDEEAKLFAAPPYAADSEVVVGAAAPANLRPVCDVRTARTFLRPYLADPIVMRVARFRIEAEKRDMVHAAAVRDAHTFWFAGQQAGYFEAPFPSSAGIYRYMPYRCAGHSMLHQAIRGGERPACGTAGYDFVVLGFPGVFRIAIGNFALRRRAGGE